MQEPLGSLRERESETPQATGHATDRIIPPNDGHTLWDRARRKCSTTNTPRVARRRFWGPWANSQTHRAPTQVGSCSPATSVQKSDLDAGQHDPKLIISKKEHANAERRQQKNNSVGAPLSWRAYSRWPALSGHVQVRDPLLWVAAPSRSSRALLVRTRAAHLRETPLFTLFFSCFVFFFHFCLFFEK